MSRSELLCKEVDIVVESGEMRGPGTILRVVEDSKVGLALGVSSCSGVE